MILALSLFVACEATFEPIIYTCDVELLSAKPDQGAAGDSVTLTARPMTTTWDTALYVGDTEATVDTVDRESCDDCDECREDAGCTDCSDCDACDLACDTECIETASFTVPNHPAGKAPLTLFNGYGQSTTLEFLVVD